MWGSWRHEASTFYSSVNNTDPFQSTCNIYFHTSELLACRPAACFLCLVSHQRLRLWRGVASLSDGFRSRCLKKVSMAPSCFTKSCFASSKRCQHRVQTNDCRSQIADKFAIFLSCVPAGVAVSRCLFRWVKSSKLKREKMISRWKSQLVCCEFNEADAWFCKQLNLMCSQIH